MFAGIIRIIGIQRIRAERVSKENRTSDCDDNYAIHNYNVINQSSII